MDLSLDGLTASELNAAIDDTNFPKAQSTTSLSSSTSWPKDDESQPNSHQPNGKTVHDLNTQNGNDEIDAKTNNETTADAETNASPNGVNNVQNGHTGFIKRTHPAPLRMVAFKGDSIDVPGTPRTPRTSTTPGKRNGKSFFDSKFFGYSR